MANNSLTHASLPSCGDPNTPIPAPAFLGSHPGAACVVSNEDARAPELLNLCCNPNASRLKTGYQRITIHTTDATDFDAQGCPWSFCNVTGSEGIKAFETCLKKEDAVGQGKCFTGVGGAGNETATLKKGNKNSKSKPQTSGSGSIKWRSEKKKTTVSAALLMALGVAGIVLGT